MEHPPGISGGGVGTIGTETIEDDVRYRSITGATWVS